MKKNIYYSSLRKLVFLAIDVSLLYISLRFATLLPIASSLPESSFSLNFLLFALLWVFISQWFGNKNDSIERSIFFKNVVGNLVYPFIFHALLFFTYMVTIQLQPIPLPYFLNVYVIAFGFIFINRVIGFYFAKKYAYAYFKLLRSKISVIRTRTIAVPYYKLSIKKNLSEKEFMSSQEVNPEAKPYRSFIKETISNLKIFSLQERFPETYFALPVYSSKVLLEEIPNLEEDNHISYRVTPDVSNITTRDIYFNYEDNIPVIPIRKRPLEVVFNQIVKRAFDILFSLLVIILVFPWVFPVIMLAIKLTSTGPVFFKQPRAGKEKKPFLCFKFRTMFLNNLPHIQATKYDPRVTKVGRFLRKTNLDELPQFFNVLLGDMSVVGPRPYIFNQVEEYSKAIEEYELRHFVSPGITGYAQVNGLRGEVHHLHLMEKRVQYDIQYVENWSFLLDLQIIFLTVRNMIKGEENAY